MKRRTLLTDLEKIYNSLPCMDEYNYCCYACSRCKNKEICDVLAILIGSIRKHYLQSTRNYYKKFL